MAEDCKVRITGVVWCVEGRGRRAAPHGVYLLRRVSAELYSCQGFGLPFFYLTGDEVANYLEGDMEIISGQLP
jgi:hypothetical protein